MKLTAFDHIVLCVADVARTITFYKTMLGMRAREERPGKWSLHFGDCKISLQDAAKSPEIARETVPGSGNFCIIAEQPVQQIAEALQAQGVKIITGPVERDGAVSNLLSIYFHDPDRNLAELSNRTNHF